MSALLPRGLVVLLALTVGMLGSAQEPGRGPKKAGEPAQKPMEELLPPPKMVPQPGNLFFPYVPSQFPQWGTREVWQFYGVDGAGRFRPRVIMSPFGAYYAVNGNPFPWTTSQPRLYMPYILD